MLGIVLSCSEQFEGADWSGHLFALIVTAMISNRNLTMSPFSVVRGGQDDTAYALIGYILRKVFADG